MPSLALSVIVLVGVEEVACLDLADVADEGKYGTTCTTVLAFVSETLSYQSKPKEMPFHIDIATIAIDTSSLLPGSFTSSYGFAPSPVCAACGMSLSSYRTSLQRPPIQCSVFLC